MNKIEELLELTEQLRDHLDQLINEKQDLLDQEVIVASQMLDSILNQYYEVLSKKKVDK
ncbi:aspartyl-phosphate phosphatase Spo0E family protein [Clostridium lundense]|uniref:aspartyl-phosphate phosphatase Spo0E family protein n=1 Tax=Clostridium lundense TaxID=319475 RepID=UPI000A078914|nr:aspartyl-phosphate phosphatase Spo0E family protein [Clostridium lundense]